MKLTTSKHPLTNLITLLHNSCTIMVSLSEIKVSVVLFTSVHQGAVGVVTEEALVLYQHDIANVSSQKIGMLSNFFQLEDFFLKDLF